MPEKPNGSLVFLKGCWRSDIFSDGPRKATVTWCFDDKGGGRYLYSRTDQGSFYCHGLALARWNGAKLDLSSANPTCDIDISGLQLVNVPGPTNIDTFALGQTPVGSLLNLWP